MGALKQVGVFSPGQSQGGSLKFLMSVLLVHPILAQTKVGFYTRVHYQSPPISSNPIGQEHKMRP